jgi:hypothetical protein
MPDVSSAAPSDASQWIVFDVHKHSLVAGVCLHHRHRTLISNGKTPTIATVARELCGFLWAAMTSQPLREEVAAA